MKLLAIIGSRKNGNTDRVVTKYLEIMSNNYPDIQYKVINLHDYRIDSCISCKKCLFYGEEFCPLKDDFKDLLNDVVEHDALVIASPNFVSNVSGRMKTFIDRAAYLGHRPRFFNKWAFTITTSAGPGGSSKSREALACLWEASGFNIMKGVIIYSPPFKDIEDVLESQKGKMERKSNRLYKLINEHTRKTPSLSMLTSFNFFKAFFISRPDFIKKYYPCDYEYYKKNGWLDKKAKYFDDRKLGWLKGPLTYVIFAIFKIVSNYGLKNN
jgi:multimeric flavodoxin WrbA